VRLARPSAACEREFLRAVRRSRRLHGAWVSPPATPAAYRRYMQRIRRPTHVGYLVRRGDSGALVGVVNVSEIVRGAFQSAYLGYYAFVPEAGRGLMRQGLALVIEEGFAGLGLHRLEANIQPGNVASRRLVRRLGFRREGFSPRYLKIAGRWRDHERWALLREDWRRCRHSSRARMAATNASRSSRPCSKMSMTMRRSTTSYP
jgi:ribosomal-protein-alanine N-acetyltransferase